MNLNEKLTCDTLLKFIIFENDKVEFGKLKIIKE